MNDEVIEAAAALVRDWGVPVAWVTAVPSRARGETAATSRRRALAAALGLPFHDVLARTRTARRRPRCATPPSRSANVRGAYAVSGAVPPGPACWSTTGAQSGWTVAMVGGQLRQKGAGPVYPFVLTSAVLRSRGGPTRLDAASSSSSPSRAPALGDGRRTPRSTHATAIPRRSPILKSVAASISTAIAPAARHARRGSSRGS